ncbi:membrane protein [Planococcus halocryophilus Or1]|nr:membrane protein [Planococcus halocryophilus Or1]
MAQMLALSIIVLVLFIGEAVSIRTKAWIPSIFVSGVLFLLGYWTFFPADIVALSGVPPAVAVMLIYLLITNMGTLLSLQELKDQWRTILIALSGIAGIIAALFGIGTLLFDYQTVVVAIPPLVGGLVSALIMSEGAAAAGFPTLAVFAIVIYVVQGFAGYPLTSIMLKKEGENLLTKYRNNELILKEMPTNQPGTVDKAVKEPRMFAKMPDKYNTDFLSFPFGFSWLLSLFNSNTSNTSS